MRGLRFLLGGLMCAAFLAGCNSGPKLVTVNGVITKDGKPLSISPTGYVQVIMVPDVGPDAQYTTYPGRADATGKFTIEEVPVGKYRVVVEHMDPNPASDLLAGVYSLQNSKIKREVDGKTPLTIELNDEK